MKIYMDTCCLQRPLDQRVQLRIKLEAEAVLCILAACSDGLAQLIASDALAFEANRNSEEIRRDHVLSLLEISTIQVLTNDAIASRTNEFVSLGLKPLDALHLASAEKAGADYFCTCDDKLLRRGRTNKSLKVKIVSPIDLAREISK